MGLWEILFRFKHKHCYNMSMKRGFTIIEVVLVLAIAGLIFLVVFLALPQLQRSQRDSTRKSMAQRAVAALTQYASNNSASFPAESTSNGSSNFGTYDQSTSFFESYLDQNDDFTDPKSGQLSVVFPSVTPASYTPNEGELAYWLGVDCDGASASNAVSIMIALEQGTYCEDNI